MIKDENFAFIMFIKFVMYEQSGVVSGNFPFPIFLYFFHNHTIYYRIGDRKMSFANYEIPPKCAVFHIGKGRPLLCACQANELII